MTTKSYRITKTYAERPCFCIADCWDHWVEETHWNVIEDGTGRFIEFYETKKDAVARAKYDGATISEIEA